MQSTALSSGKQHSQEKREGQGNTAQRYRLSHHMCITSNRAFSSQSKQPSQASLLQTEYTLNKDCFIALLYSTCHEQRVVCLAGIGLGLGFDRVLIRISKTGLGETEKRKI